MTEVLYDFTGWHTQHARAISNAKEILEVRALEARLSGYSHKGFLVGAAGLCYGPQGYRIVYGHNFKPEKGTEGPRVCAENHMMHYAFLKGCTEIISFSIASLYQPDDTFHKGLDDCSVPCIYCRHQFIDSIHCGDLIKPQTLLNTLRVDCVERPFEVVRKASCTIRELLIEFPDEEPIHML
jgi:cytidine deaminase